MKEHPDEFYVIRTGMKKGDAVEENKTGSEICCDNSKCPDKLEPKKQQYLTSVLKNVPVELMWHLREYQSKPSHFEIKWRARQPVEGKKYGWGGDLKWEDAQSGDMYVRDRSLEQKYHHLLDKHRALRSEYDDLLADHMKEISDGEEWKARHDDLLMQADDDYDAVTKGVISLINLLRR